MQKKCKKDAKKMLNKCQMQKNMSKKCQKNANHNWKCQAKPESLKNAKKMPNKS